MPRAFRVVSIKIVFIIHFQFAFVPSLSGIEHHKQSQHLANLHLYIPEDITFSGDNMPVGVSHGTDDEGPRDRGNNNSIHLDLMSIRSYFGAV